MPPHTLCVGLKVMFSGAWHQQWFWYGKKCKGKIKDVVVDIRKNSPTYRQYFDIELDDQKGQYLYIPEGICPRLCSPLRNGSVPIQMWRVLPSGGHWRSRFWRVMYILSMRWSHGWSLWAAAIKTCRNLHQTSYFSHQTSLRLYHHRNLIGSPSAFSLALSK